jgi:adhesin/invasin
MTRYLALLALVACSSDGLVLPSDREPAAVTIVVGNAQVDTVGRVLPESLVVRVTDQDDRPIMNQSVRFINSQGQSGLHAIPETAQTDADGRASARLVLGTAAGPQVVQVRVELATGAITADVRVVALAAAPDTVYAASGNPQGGTVGGELDQSLIARATDRYGNPVSDVPVSWAVVGGGSVSAEETVTDAAGQASVRRTLGTTPGAQQTTATAPTLKGSPVVFDHTATQGTPASLLLESGNQQAGRPGQPLGLPIVVRLVDALGNGVPGRTVTWPVASGGGSVVAASPVTDAGGRVSAIWTLGPDEGTQIVIPTSGAITAIVTATASASPPTTIAANSPTQLSGTVGQPVSPTPSVLVTDAQGRPVPGVVVNFAVTNGGGSVITTEAVTDGVGVATPTGWTLGPKTGTNTLTTSASGADGALAGSPVTFTAAAGPGPMSRLAIVKQPSQTGVSGVPLAQSPVVQLRDANDNDVTTGGISISTAITGDPLNATLTGAVASTNANGTATFTGLTLTAPGATYTLRFSGPAPLEGATSNGIVLTGRVGSVTIVVQPSATLANGSVLPVQPSVRVLDEFANPMASVSVEATVESGDGALGGQATVGTDAAGVATFTDLSLTGTTGSYVLRMSAGAESAATESITLTPGPVSASATTANVPARGRANQQTVITVQSRDQSGNLVTTGGHTVMVTITGTNPAGSFLATDNGDGTYRATYVPHSKGKDFIAITLDGTAIKGSPFTSDVR